LAISELDEIDLQLENINTIADFWPILKYVTKSTADSGVLVFGWLAIADRHWTGVPVSVGFASRLRMWRASRYGSMRMNEESKKSATTRTAAWGA